MYSMSISFVQEKGLSSSPDLCQEKGTIEDNLTKKPDDNRIIKTYILYLYIKLIYIGRFDLN